MAREPKDYAVLIGIQNYPELDNNNLQGPHDDVDRLRKWLLDDVHGGGVSGEHCATVLSNGAPGLPVQTEIDDAFTAMLKTMQATGGRRLYVYFSGHGIAGGLSQALLCLANWSLNTRINAALDEHLYRTVLGEYGFEEVVFFIDCCRSQVFGAEGLRPQFRKVPARPAGRSFLGNATRDKFPSFEAGEEIVRGHFTRALLEGLWGAAGSPDDKLPGVTAQSLKDYVETRTTEVARSFRQDQEAVVEFSLKSPAIFGRAPLTGDVVLRVPGGLPALDVVAPDGKVTASRPAGEGGDWAISVPRGEHVVRKSSGELLKNFRARSTVEVTRVEL